MVVKEYYTELKERLVTAKGQEKVKIHEELCKGKYRGDKNE